MKTTTLTAPRPKESKLEYKFRLMWENHYPHLPLVAEYRFAPPRLFRADFCHLETKTLIEIEGGSFSGGRHTRGTGFEKDCEKYNLAANNGFRVFRLTGAMLKTTEHLELIAAAIQAAGVAA